MYRLLYVIGVPGSGKTELVRELVKGRRRRVRTEPFAHTLYEDGLVQLGRDREGHGGTDALSMNAMVSVVAALETRVWERVLAEGDRLANMAFFRDARAAGYVVDVIHLVASPELAAERRAARGTTQDEKWLRGRVTKVEHLQGYLRDAGFRVIDLDAREPVEALAALVVEHPVVRPG